MSWRRMEVFKTIDSVAFHKNTMITVGAFDGIHLGHHAIIDNLIREAKRHFGRSILLTFSPHPQHFFAGNENRLPLLTTFDEKIEQLQKKDLDAVLVLPFNEKIAQMSPETFLQTIQDRIGLKALILGHNHSIGRNREGNIGKIREISREQDFSLIEVDPVFFEKQEISSTSVRNFLSAGKVDQAARFLGRQYTAKGHVIRGQSIGREIGYPTANLEFSDTDKLMPADGIYAGFICHNGQGYGAMIYIGSAPTLENGSHRVEAHLFDFSQSIYDDQIEIAFVEKIRDDRQFDRLDQLKKQIQKDEIIIKQILEQYHWRLIWDCPRKQKQQL